MRTQRPLAALFMDFHDTPIYYYPVHRRLVRKLSSTILISFLLRQFQYRKRTKIFEKDDFVLEDTGLNPDELKGAKEEVKELPWITVTREGVRGVTHYEIDPIKLETALQGLSDRGNSPNYLDGGISPNRNPSDRGNSPNSLKRKDPNTENTTLSHPAYAGNGTHEVGGVFLRLAQKLADAIAKVRKVNSNAKIKGWARHFELLHTKDGVPVPRIKRGLRWYCERIPTHDGDPHFLVIHSGESFREKFQKLELAITREERFAQANGNGNGHPVETIPAPTFHIVNSRTLIED